MEFTTKFSTELRESFSSGVYLTNYLSESIYIWTMGTLEGLLSCHEFLLQGSCPGWGWRSKSRTPLKVFLYFLAHLSRRLTRWAYRMGLAPGSVCPSVRPHFQTWISPRPVGRLQPNFIRSIIGVGERLHQVLVQIRSELWFPWQRIAPIGL